MKILIVTVLTLFLTGSFLAADPPPIIKDGFESYKENGVASGFETWLRGSALEGDTTTKVGVLGGMTQIEAAYGKMESYEILATFSPTVRLRRVYAVSYHAKGPVFSYFDVYRTEKAWVVYMLNFNTKPQEILPRPLIDKNG
jgi:hypothetical protein